MKGRARRILTTISVFVGLLAMVPAQAESRMTIHGTVTDPLGHPLAKVRISDGAQSTYTNADGHYVLEEEALGTYQVTASRSGLNRQSKVVDPVTALLPVDFQLTYNLTGGVSPSMFNNDVPVTLAIAATSYAPISGQCVTFTDVVSGQRVELTVSSQDGTQSTWTGSYAVPAGAADGRYDWRIDSIDCGSSTVLTNVPSYTYIIDSLAPNISDPTPMGRAVSPETLTAKILDHGGSGINGSSVRFKLDGVDFPAISHDPNTGLTVAAVDGVGEGTHHVVVTASDYAGNTSSLTFSFVVDNNPPTLTDPTPQGVLSDRSPLISIHTSADGSGIANFRMVISNGLLSNDLDASYDPTSGSIAYQVPSYVSGPGLGEFPLIDDTYTVKVSVWDLEGNTNTREWKFTIRALPV